MNELFSDADVISSYSRHRAIEDGVLVDVTPTAREVGFRYPVAMTRAAWADAVEWRDWERERWKAASGAAAVQDERGRLWDVLSLLRFAAIGRKGDRLAFTVRAVDRELGRVRVKMLVAHVGPGDDAEPVLTIMLPDED